MPKNIIRLNQIKTTMMKIKILLLSFLFLNLVEVNNIVAQTDCNSNAGFENGTTSGWVCTYGGYGAGLLSGFCPAGGAGVCPEWPINVDSVGILNVNGINAPL